MARLPVELSPVALADLDEIHGYIAEDDPDAATRWIDKLLAAAERAGDRPLAGRRVPEHADPSLRERIVGNYRIVYRIEARRVLIVTIIEGHRRLKL